MNFKGTPIAVSDIEKAKRFYCDLLDLEIVDDLGVHVVLTGGVFLQTIDTWAGFIQKTEANVICANNASELYFEADDIDGFMIKLSSYPDIVYLHPLIKHTWGQRAVRFYDPDGHIVEVGERMR